jgi:hypothetical protein
VLARLCRISPCASFTSTPAICSQVANDLRSTCQFTVDAELSASWLKMPGQDVVVAHGRSFGQNKYPTSGRQSKRLPKGIAPSGFL